MRGGCWSGALRSGDLLFAVSVQQRLFQDENFVNLLRAEGLGTPPKYLAERV